MENSSKYLNNKKFIQWVFQPNEELEKWWKTFEKNHPEEKQNIQLARKILHNFKTSDKQLTQEEKIVLFSNILKQVEENQSKGRNLRITKALLKYAAVAILFFAIGALLFYNEDQINPQFFVQQMAEPVSGTEAKLIRHNGENIVLNEQNSIIRHQADGKLTINNSTINEAPAQNERTPEMNQLIIPYGKTSELWLADGTRVYLNAGSRLVYPEFFVDKTREVLLIGEAFFEVNHDEEHPFIVQTTDLRVRVLGTQFNISAYPTDNIIETVLTEGSVQLKQNNSGIFTETTNLSPNQLAAFNRDSKEITVKTVDTDNYTLWKEGLFKFESTDLSRIVKKLERYYNISFRYNNPLLGTIKISGKLELANNREEVINRLAIAASVTVVKKGANDYEIKE